MDFRGGFVRDVFCLSSRQSQTTPFSQRQLPLGHGIQLKIYILVNPRIALFVGAWRSPRLRYVKYIVCLFEGGDLCKFDFYSLCMTCSCTLGASSSEFLTELL